MGSGGTPKNATKSTFSLFDSGVEGGEGGEPVPLVPKSVSSQEHQQHQHYDKKKSGAVVGKNASTSKFSLFESVDSLEGGGDVPDVPALPLGKSRGTIHEKVDAVVGGGGGGFEEGEGGEVNSSRPEDKKGILKGKTGNVKRRNTMQVVRRATFHNSSTEKQAVVEKGKSLFQLNFASLMAAAEKTSNLFEETAKAKEERLRRELEAKAKEERDRIDRLRKAEELAKSFTLELKPVAKRERELASASVSVKEKEKVKEKVKDGDELRRRPATLSFNQLMVPVLIYTLNKRLIKEIGHG
ncbi:hypothetical protein HDU79_007300 [Rhizoclosmatium sp. JEL0117]|nr:hypothetical protein HDU79_007300 [Rhizoclosmatium sp. JEL0117]